MADVKAFIVETFQEYEQAPRGGLWAIRNESGEQILGIAFRCPGCGYPGQVPLVEGTPWPRNELSGWPESPSLANKLGHLPAGNPGVGCGWQGSLTGGIWCGHGGVPMDEGWDGERAKDVEKVNRKQN